MNSLPLQSIKIEEYLLDGIHLLDCEVHFAEWFTVLSGTNGTGKSTVLRKIKEQNNTKAILYNPKRNSERKAVIQFYEEYIRGGKNKASIISNKAGSNFNDNTFEQYSSFTEIIISDFDDRWKNSNGALNGTQIIESLKTEYGGLLKSIFPDYELYDWAFKNGSPFFRIKKYGKYVLESEALSTGEQEILSLVFNINFLRDSFEILLIDEPELHLNWALEKNLFLFLKKFASRYKKQVIISTHSRVIFEETFKNNCLFLFYDDKKKIIVSNTASEEIKKSISGEILNITLSKISTNIYVEDNFHKKVIDKFAQKLNKINYNIQLMKDKQSVNSLFDSVRYQPNRGLLTNSYFAMDGDLDKDKVPNDKTYVKLPTYCLESAFFDLRILSAISGKTKTEIKLIILNEINKVKKKKSKGRLSQKGVLVESDIVQKALNEYDSSQIISNVIRKIGFTENGFLDKYLDQVISKSKIKAIYGQKFHSMIDSLENKKS